jgi:uncharacterized protein YprB with RNaseH-like and TPR domain
VPCLCRSKFECASLFGIAHAEAVKLVRSGPAARLVSMASKEAASKIVNDVIRVAREIGRTPTLEEYLAPGAGKYSEAQIKVAFHNWETGLKAAGLTRNRRFDVRKDEPRDPKILLFDIETAPLGVFTFGLFDQNIGLNQINEDWCLLSFAAKWLGSPVSEVFYWDQSKEPNMRDDKKLLKRLWKLLDEADIVITQNGKSFDEKKANARFIINGLPPPKPFKHIDTKQLAKKRFCFTSNKLEYLAEALGVPFKKLKHKEFPGMELWTECLKRNKRAWAEMKLYNIADVLSLEGVYKRLAPWGVGLDLNVFHGDAVHRCSCGSTNLTKRGFRFTVTGKFQQYVCRDCGSWSTAKGAANNLFSDRKQASLKNPREG